MSLHSVLTSKIDFFLNYMRNNSFESQMLILKQWIWLREESALENQREDLQGVGQRKPDGHLDFEGEGREE